MTSHSGVNSHHFAAYPNGKIVNAVLSCWGTISRTYVILTLNKACGTRRKTLQTQDSKWRMITGSNAHAQASSSTCSQFQPRAHCHGTHAPGGAAADTVSVGAVVTWRIFRAHGLSSNKVQKPVYTQLTSTASQQSWRKGFRRRTGTHLWTRNSLIEEPLKKFAPCCAVGRLALLRL